MQIRSPERFVFLSRPYPHQPNRWVILVLLPLFISLFLVTFQPFGLHGFRHEHKHLLLIGYGGITLLALALHMYLLPAIIPGMYREQTWTVLKEIIYLLIIVLTISLGNYIYSVAFDIARWLGISGLLIFIGFTFAIAVVPIVLIIAYSYTLMLKRHLAMAGKISTYLPGQSTESSRDVTFRIESENGQHEITARISQLISIESEGNYIVASIAREGKVIRETLRNTIKSIEMQLMDSKTIFRCHRAFMINLEHIERVDGNSQGYRLTLRYLDYQVPVSRSYIRRFDEALRNTQT